MADIYGIIPHFFAYEGLQSTNSVRIRFIQAEESKYEILIIHINGSLEPESPNFEPNHAFLSSIEAEIITFLPKKVAIFFLAFFCVAFTAVL